MDTAALIDIVLRAIQETEQKPTQPLWRYAGWDSLANRLKLGQVFTDPHFSGSDITRLTLVFDGQAFFVHPVGIASKNVVGTGFAAITPMSAVTIAYIESLIGQVNEDNRTVRAYLWQQWWKFYNPHMRAHGY